MPSNRKQRQRVAKALTSTGLLARANPTLVVACMVAGDRAELLEVLAEVLPSEKAHRALPAVARAAGMM